MTIPPVSPPFFQLLHTMQTPGTTNVDHPCDDQVRQIVALVHPIRIYVFGSAGQA